MFATAFRYPFHERAARDSFAICTGLVLGTLLLVRIGLALWPDWLAAIPLALVVGPTALFAGYLGRLLLVGERSVEPAFTWSRESLRVGLQVLAVAGVYSTPALLALVGTAYVLLEGSSVGSLLTIAPTIALLATVVSVYVLPAALAATAHDGVRAGLSRESLNGIASGSYFFAWTIATTLVVVGWSLIAATRVATPAALLGAVVFAYTHLVAARLLGDGLARSRWEA